MIRREREGRYYLITQHEHALLSGRLAERWGNRDFEAPEPRESVIRGISMHDCGWPLHDERPTLNDKGAPLNVFETPRRIGTPVWTLSAERAAAVDPYAGLLVSLHVLSLSMLPSIYSPTPHDVFELNKFQHQEIERQESMRQALGLRTDRPLKLGLAEPGVDPEEDRLANNFHLLQALDKLSLSLCFANGLFERLEHVGLKLSHSREEPATILLDPWPFAMDQIEESVPSKVIEQKQFENETEFQQAYAAATVEQLALRLRPGRAADGSRR